MFKNCYKLIFDSHALLLKIFKIFEYSPSAGLSDLNNSVSDSNGGLIQ